MPLDEEYVKEVEKICDEYDLVFITDEVQTGVGRTGELFAFQYYGIKPDIVTAAKGIGGGLPLGCILFGEKTEGVFGPGDHATTFGGNPVATAGAVHILNRLDTDFLAEVKAKGDYIRQKLMQMPHVAGIDGLGLMMGIRLDDGIASADVVKKAIEKGALLLTAKAKVRLLPPLTITYDEIDKGLSALEETLSEM